MNKSLLVTAGLRFCLVAGLVSGCTAAPSTVGEGPSGSIIAHWSFDSDEFEGGDVRDSGPSGFHGVVQSENETPLVRVQGIRGEAVQFPAGHESWIEIDKRFRMEPPFTITAWVKVSGTRSTMEIFGQKAHSWDQGMRFTFSLRRMFFEYSDGAEDIVVRNDVHQTRRDQWAFIGVVHDGEEIALYVDAEEIHREPAREMRFTGRTAMIGNYVVAKDAYGFIGSMDEIIILNEALTSEDFVELGLWALTTTPEVN